MRYTLTLLALLMTTTVHAEETPAADRGEIVESGAWLRVKTPWDAGTEKKLNDIIEKCQTAFEKADPATTTYESSFLEWDLMDADIKVVNGFGSWDFNNSTEEKVREKGEKADELTQKLIARLYNLKAPYALLKQTFDRIGASLTEARRQFARDTLRDFEKNGVHLEGEDRKKLQKLDEEKASLSTAITKGLKEKEVLVPVTSEQAKSLTTDSLKVDEKTGAQQLVLREDTYLDVMRRHPDGAFRETCYHKFYEGTADIVPLFDRLRHLRRERAQLVAKTDYVTSELEDEGFTPTEVHSTLDALKKYTSARFDETMVDYKALNGGKAPRSFDFLYLEESAPSDGVNPDVFLEYFTPERAVQTLFDLSGKLYGLKFEHKSPEGEHPIDHYRVLDKDGAEIGSLTLDLFPRAKKYSHAACWTMQGRSTHHPDRKAVVGLSMNLKKKPLPGGGVGLLQDEVTTLFHEFGHVLHAFLIHSEPLGAHDSPASLVEVPSQVFESWVLDPVVLEKLARHYQKDQPLTDELKKALYHKSQRFAARAVRTQILYALFDLTFHEKVDSPPQEIWETLTKDLFGAEVYPTGVPWFSRFGHLDGYGSKYWGYKFADLGKAQIYWYLVRRFPDMTTPEVGAFMRDDFLVYGGLKKLPQAAKDVTGIPLTPLPYVLETLLDYPTLRERLTAAKGDYAQALEAVFSSLSAGK